jgi:hypothetical protein
MRGFFSSRERPGEALTAAKPALAAHELISGSTHPWTRDSADALDDLGRPEDLQAVRTKYKLSSTGDGTARH